MRRRRIQVAMIVGLAAASLCPAQQITQETVKSLLASSAPGPMHALLARDVGTWTCEVTRYLGSQEVKEQATVTYTMILAGRFQQSAYRGVLLGQPIEGMGIDGYDETTKTFHSVWIDTLNRGVVFLKGTWDAATKRITYVDRQIDPSTKKEIGIKGIAHYDDPNRRVYNTYAVTDGREIPVQRSVCSREK